MADNTQNNNNKFPTKRDFWYIVIIFTIIIVFILSLQISGIGELNSKLSFAGTITSIILSVIAIIYTLIESIKSSSVQNDLTSSSKNIIDITNNLEKSIEELRSTSAYFETIEEIAKELAYVKESVIGVKDEINTNLNSNFSTLFQNIVPLSPSHSTDNKMEFHSNIADKPLGYICSLLCHYIYENKFDIISTFDKYSELKYTEHAQFNSGALTGVAIALICDGLMNTEVMDESEETTKITYFDEDYYDKLCNHINYMEYNTEISDFITSLKN